jgi:hypothetical protein
MTTIRSAFSLAFLGCAALIPACRAIASGPQAATRTLQVPLAGDPGGHKM